MLSTYTQKSSEGPIQPETGPEDESAAEFSNVIMSLHQGENQCFICGESFKQKGYLRRHINAVHEKKKPYKCNKCPKGFITKDHLKR